MSAPSVYAAINAITAELATKGIAKTRTNEVDDYKYRSIDDVLDRLAPLLSTHRLCVLPRALERTVTEGADSVNAAGAKAYPISGLTYILLYKEQADAKKGKALVDLLDWTLTDGQKMAPDLQYAPLPQSVADLDTSTLARVTSGGQPLLSGGSATPSEWG